MQTQNVTYILGYSSTIVEISQRESLMRNGESLVSWRTRRVHANSLSFSRSVDNFH